MAKARKVVRAEKKEATMVEVDAMATEFRALKDGEKDNKKQQAKLKPQLMDFLDREGEECDDGSSSVNTGNNLLTKSCRNTVIVDEEVAMKVLSKVVFARVTKPCIDKDLLEEQHTVGNISDEQMGRILVVKKTPVFTVRAAP